MILLLLFLQSMRCLNETAIENNLIENAAVKFTNSTWESSSVKLSETITEFEANNKTEVNINKLKENITEG